MSALSAQRAAGAVEMCELVVAIELLLAAQAMDLRGGKPGDGTRRAHRQLRSEVTFMESDRMTLKLSATSSGAEP